MNPTDNSMVDELLREQDQINAELRRLEQREAAWKAGWRERRGRSLTAFERREIAALRRDRERLEAESASCRSRAMRLKGDGFTDLVRKMLFGPAPSS